MKRRVHPTYAFSVRRLIAQFTSPMGVALAGWVGGQFDPGLVIAASGALLLAFSSVQLFNPYLLRVEDKAWLDEMAEEHEARRARTMAPAGTTESDLASAVEDALPEGILHEDITSVI
jgi:hypothetical protein